MKTPSLRSIKDAISVLEDDPTVEPETVRFIEIGLNKYRNVLIGSQKARMERAKKHREITASPRGERWITIEEGFRYEYRINGQTYSLEQAYDIEFSMEEEDRLHRRMRM